MTNSIASAKCSSNSLFSGNYGMTQNYFADESKEYIFVKLTDSAYRAIEEYQRNESARYFKNTNQGPKIQFVGNSGIIEFPTPDHTKGGGGTADGGSGGSGGSGNGGGGSRKFGFSIDDVEGSLECIQQTSHQSTLDVLGSLSYRMRIHANEDVYDTTRTKMAIAEETEKSKCIREIKPNQTDIGRKVKKPPHSSSSFLSHHIHHGGSSGGASSSSSINNSSSSSSLLQSNSSHRSKLVSPSHGSADGVGGGSTGSASSANNLKFGTAATASSRSPNPLLNNNNSNSVNANNKRNSNQNTYGGLSSSSNSNINNNNNNSYFSNSGSNTNSNLSSAASLSMTLAGGFVNGYTSTGSPNQDSTFSARNKSGAAGMQNSSLKNSKGAGSSGTNGKYPELARRKIRERLIHLLALRPFKKLELYSRLQQEGLKERERQVIANILKDISTVARDNTYNLKRQMWNDVNENWPFFTAQEIQQLKRRKPQNLTPPLSSDAGSSTSGQSPTSTHNGSPPPLTSSNSHSVSNDNLKRTSLDSDRTDETFLSGVQTKKQRISHYKKDNIPYSSSTTSNNVNINRSGLGSSSNNNNNNNNINNNHNSSSNNNNSNHHQLQQHQQQQQYNSSKSLSTLNSPNSIIRTVDEHFGNTTDLSYNILENMDEFMPHLDRNTHYGTTANTTTDRTPHSRKTLEDEQHMSGFASKNPYSNAVEQHQQQQQGHGNSYGTSLSLYASKFDEHRNSKESGNVSSGIGVTPAAANSHISPKSSSSSLLASSPYNDFQSSALNAAENTAKLSHSPHYRHASSTASPSKSRQRTGSGNSYKSKVSFRPASSDSGFSDRDRDRDRDSKYQQLQQHAESLPKKSARSSTPPSSSYQHQKKQSKVTPEVKSLPSAHQQQLAANESFASSSSLGADQTNYVVARDVSASMASPTTQLKHHSSPVQQMEGGKYSPNVELSNAAMGGSSSHSVQPQYDFSNYTPITTIEQRRHYKTEFESDYDEYRKLLAQIESVSKRFRELADRLENARQNCADYENIKKQILYEYDRIRNEETLKRDKQRFDYLHEKLAYIKQLVTDYDKTLTAATQQLPCANSTDAFLGKANVAATASPNMRGTSMAVNVEGNPYSPGNAFKQEQAYEQHHQLQPQQQRSIPSLMMSNMNYQNQSSSSNSDQGFCKRSPENMKSSPKELQFHESSTLAGLPNPSASATGINHVNMNMNIAGNYNINHPNRYQSAHSDDDDDDEDDEDDSDDQESDDDSSKSNSPARGGNDADTHGGVSERRAHHMDHNMSASNNSDNDSDDDDEDDDDDNDDDQLY